MQSRGTNANSEMNPQCGTRYGIDASMPVAAERASRRRLSDLFEEVCFLINFCAQKDRAKLIIFDNSLKH